MTRDERAVREKSMGERVSKKFSNFIIWINNFDQLDLNDRKIVYKVFK